MTDVGVVVVGALDIGAVPVARLHVNVRVLDVLAQLKRVVVWDPPPIRDTLDRASTATALVAPRSE